MFDIKKKKTASMIISLFVALCFVVTSVGLYKSALIPGVSTELDEAKEQARIYANKSRIIEGIFLDRNLEEITSYSEMGEAAKINHPESFSHIIGYNSKRMGVDLLRLRLSPYLFDGGKDNIGATVQLTLDANLQNRLYPLLKGFVGSISVIDAETGEILAMVSRGHPELGYNLELIDTVYEEKADKKVFYSDIYGEIPGFYMNRAVFAEDPPGSCAKVMTSVSLIENGQEDMTYLDNTIYYNDTDIHNFDYKCRGETNLQKALNESVNTYFAHAGTILGAKKLEKTFNSFMVGKTIELDFATLKSNFLNEKNDNFSFIIASNAYGQGQLVMTPLHIAMMMGAIVNDGKMMKPYLIEKITNDDKVLLESERLLLSEVTEEKNNETIKKLLLNNADYYGFYEHFSKKDINIYAKTGTAEVAQESKGNHIYYSMGVEINGKAYGICVDRTEVHGFSSVLEDTAIETVKILLDEYGN